MTDKPPTGGQPPLIIDADLHERLIALAERAQAHLPKVATQLLEEIERADLRPSIEMPPDVVTIGSEVTFEDVDRGVTQTVKVVFPNEANIDERRISILTPIGAALLGLSVGQRRGWEMADGRIRHLAVVNVR
jgi:regulator of nucleoside diphosphate kinase